MICHTSRLENNIGHDFLYIYISHGLCYFPILMYDISSYKFPLIASKSGSSSLYEPDGITYRVFVIDALHSAQFAVFRYMRPPRWVDCMA